MPFNFRLEIFVIMIDTKKVILEDALMFVFSHGMVHKTIKAIFILLITTLTSRLEALKTNQHRNHSFSYLTNHHRSVKF